MSETCPPSPNLGSDGLNTPKNSDKMKRPSMTVSYNLDVSSANSFTFVKLLLKWRGSILKSVRWELSIWILCFGIIQLIYKFSLPNEYQRIFETTAIYLNSHLTYIPLTFMLGFFVTIVVDRWRSVFTNIAFIENAALSVSTLIHGKNEEVRIIKRSIIRYLVLSQVLVLRDISMRVRRRFPSMQSLVEAGFIFNDELRKLHILDTPYNKYWLPVSWANSLVYKAMFDTKNIDSVQSMNSLLNNIKEFRQSMEMLCKYDWVPIPIAYPQVVFMAVRVYFIICLISRQKLIMNEVEPQSIFPFMTILQFIFFVGWMKVAEALLNPLGEDDDDFECNWLIDKNITTGMHIVDSDHFSCPSLRADRFSDDDYKPMYSENSKLIGQDLPILPSLVGIELGTQEQMLKVDPASEIRKYSEGTNLRRKLTNAIMQKNTLRSMSTVIHPTCNNEQTRIGPRIQISDHDTRPS